MGAIKLRPYQQEAMDSVISCWDGGCKRVLLVLPTGCGKTIVFAKIAEYEVRQGHRVLIMAHRGELLEQAADKIKKSTGLGCAVEKADQTCLGEFYRIVVGSVQTLMNPDRLKRFSQDYFDTIIIDEAHHCVSDSYQRVLQYFGNARVLGVTATPDRSDMRELGSYFETLAYEYTLPKAIKEKYLSPIRAMTIPLKLDITGVGMSGGDFKVGDIGTALDPYLEQIAEQMVIHCKNKKTLVFLPLIKTSQKFRDILNNHGFSAGEVNGNSEDRAEVLKDFENGKYNVLCNSMLLTEGYDCPSIDCVIVLRPTKVRSLFQQMVGRGTRLAEGKDHLLLMDFLWMTTRIDLCHPASLICEDQEIAQKMTDNLAKNAGCAVDIESAEETATEDVQIEREEALAKQLEAQRRKKARLVDPLQYEMSIGDIDLRDYKPSFGQEMQAPTDMQMKRLEKLSINPESIDSFGKADKLIASLENRQMEGLTTPKQIRQLEQRGFKNVGQWKFEQARSLIDRIAANGWRTPRSIVPQTYVPEG